MKNPFGNGFDRIYLMKFDIPKMTGFTCADCPEKYVIPVSYSRQGVATAWKCWSDTALSRAGGYGYDKESTALANAIARLIREQYMGDIPPAVELTAHAIERTGGTGVSNLMSVAREHGVEVVETYQFALSKF